MNYWVRFIISTLLLWGAGKPALAQEVKTLSPAQLPASLFGDWFYTAGNHRRAFGIEAHRVWTESTLWNYTEVKQRGDEYLLILNRKGVSRKYFIRKLTDEYVEIAERGRGYKLLKKNPLLPNVRNLPFHEISAEVSGRWYACSAQNKLYFEIKAGRVFESGKAWDIKFIETREEAYWLLLKQGKKYKVVKIKALDTGYLQYESEGQAPVLLKNGPELPNGIEIGSGDLPSTILGKWYALDQSGKLMYTLTRVGINGQAYKQVLKWGDTYQFIFENGASFYARDTKDGYLDLAGVKNQWNRFKGNARMGTVQPIKPEDLPQRLQGEWFASDSASSWVLGLTDNLLVWRNQIYTYQNILKEGGAYHFFLRAEDQDLELIITELSSTEISCKIGSEVWGRLSRRQQVVDAFRE